MCVRVAGRHRYVIAFVALALIGLGAWAITAPPSTPNLFAFGHSGFPLLALAAAVAGYLLPKGFPLWGVAVVCLHPVADAGFAAWLGPRFMLVPEKLTGTEVIGLALVLLGKSVLFAVASTLTATLGAGMRLLRWRLRGESVRGMLGMSSGSSRDA